MWRVESQHGCLARAKGSRLMHVTGGYKDMSDGEGLSHEACLSGMLRFGFHVQAKVNKSHGGVPHSRCGCTCKSKGDLCTRDSACVLKDTLALRIE